MLLSHSGRIPYNRRTFLAAAAASLAASFVPDLLFKQPRLKDPVPLPLKQRVELLLGKAPRTKLPLIVKKDLVVDAKEPFVRRLVQFNGYDGKTYDEDPIDAWLLLPNNPAKTKGAILCLHPTDHDNWGWCETAGSYTENICKGIPSDLRSPDFRYAIELTEKHDFVTLTPGYYTSETDRKNYAKFGYSSNYMKSIRNFRRAIDFLRTFYARQIGCIGHSAGGTHALYLSLYEPRIHAFVSSCGLCTWEGMMNGNYKGLNLTEIIGTYAPLVKQFITVDDPCKKSSKPIPCDVSKMPFKQEELAYALAPRPLFLQVGTGDVICAYNFLSPILPQIAQRYTTSGRPQNFVKRETPAHSFPDDVRKAAYEFLERALTPTHN